MTERACLNHDHATALRNPVVLRTAETKTEAARAERRALPVENSAGRKGRARELIGTYLHGLSEENLQRWERRVGEDAALVEFAIEEAAARRERLDSVPAYANRVYLSRVNLRAKK